MPAYQFEGVCDAGFDVSGVLCAEDEAHAQRKVRSICDTVYQLRVLDSASGMSASRSEKAEASRHAVCPSDAWRKQAITLAVSLWEALLRERHFRRRAV